MKKDGTKVKAYDRKAKGAEGAETATTPDPAASADESTGLIGLTQTQIQSQFGAPSLASGDTWYYDDSSGRLQLSFTNGVVSATILPEDFDVPIIPRIKAPEPTVELPPGPPIAKCRDGSYVVTGHRNGLCDGHGGVAQKLTTRPAKDRM